MDRALKYRCDDQVKAKDPIMSEKAIVDWLYSLPENTIEQHVSQFKLLLLLFSLFFLFLREFFKQKLSEITSLTTLLITKFAAELIVYLKISNSGPLQTPFWVKTIKTLYSNDFKLEDIGSKYEIS